MPRTPTWTCSQKMNRQWTPSLGIPSLIALPPARMRAARCSPKAPTVGTLQTLPAIEDEGSSRVASMDGFSLHAGVATQAHERDKLERVCRYFALQGCRVLRRLGTIASAAGLRFQRSACRSRQRATFVTVSKLRTVMARLMWCSSHWIFMYRMYGMTRAQEAQERPCHAWQLSTAWMQEVGQRRSSCRGAKTPSKPNPLPRRIGLKRLLLVPPTANIGRW